MGPGPPAEMEQGGSGGSDQGRCYGGRRAADEGGGYGWGRSARAGLGLKVEAFSRREGIEATVQRWGEASAKDWPGSTAGSERIKLLYLVALIKQLGRVLRSMDESHRTVEVLRIDESSGDVLGAHPQERLSAVSRTGHPLPPTQPYHHTTTTTTCPLFLVPSLPTSCSPLFAATATSPFRFLGPLGPLRERRGIRFPSLPLPSSPTRRRRPQQQSWPLAPTTQPAAVDAVSTPSGA